MNYRVRIEFWWIGAVWGAIFLARALPSSVDRRHFLFERDVLTAQVSDGGQHQVDTLVTIQTLGVF